MLEEQKTTSLETNILYILIGLGLFNLLYFYLPLPYLVIVLLKNIAYKFNRLLYSETSRPPTHIKGQKYRNIGGNVFQI